MALQTSIVNEQKSSVIVTFVWSDVSECSINIVAGAQWKLATYDSRIGGVDVVHSEESR